jgi:hypothetical protein
VIPLLRIFLTCEFKKCNSSRYVSDVCTYLLENLQVEEEMQSHEDMYF